MSKGNTFEFVSTAFNNLNLRNIFINKTKTVAEYWNFNVLVQWAQSNITRLCRNFYLTVFLLGQRGKQGKERVSSEVSLLPGLKLLPRFSPVHLYLYVYCQETLWLYFPHHLSVCYMDWNPISGFPTCSNLVSAFFHSNWESDICPRISRSITLITHLAFHFLCRHYKSKAVYISNAIFGFSCMFVVVWIGKFWLSERAWPAFLWLLILPTFNSTFLFSTTMFQNYSTLFMCSCSIAILLFFIF